MNRAHVIEDSKYIDIYKNNNNNNIKCDICHDFIWVGIWIEKKSRNEYNYSKG